MFDTATMSSSKRVANPTTAGPKLALFGAVPDTTNLGVSALFTSAIAGILRRQPDSNLTVFDFGRGLRRGSVVVDGVEYRYDRFGANDSRRLYRPDSLWNLSLSTRLGGAGNRGAKAILQADAVLDVSAGDSFTDLYGWPRFRTIYLPKLIAIDRGVPLVLLPQTYGPFRTMAARRLAERIVRSAAQAWARDGRSYEILRDLAGDRFDPVRHRCGVDLAFGLEARRPVGPFSPRLQEWLNGRRRPLTGFNVSGLIFNDPQGARDRYGFRCDYRQAVIGFLERLLRETDSDILLVPHVLSPAGAVESDAAACEAIRAVLGRTARQRVEVIPPVYDQSEMKWLIAQCDWFCGTRMHSTIAALSSGVPTAAVAYSDKTLGVFESCGQGENVLDPRLTTSAQMIDGLHAAWQRRDQARPKLLLELVSVCAAAECQLDEIVAVAGYRNNPRKGLAL